MESPPNAEDPKSLTGWILSTGADPEDDDNVCLQKRLLVASTVMMASLSLLWGSIYLVYGQSLAAAIPWSYAAASFVSLAVFSRIRRYTLFRFSQLMFSLLLPFLLMLALGGFIPSSGVVMWSVTSPLGALVFAGRKQALRWFLAFLGLVVMAAVVSPERASTLPPALVTVLFVLNITGVSLVAYVLLQAFVSEKDLALVALSRRHRWIRNAFSSYVSPNLVRYLVDNPDALNLGGERRECSFVLTDIADFTVLVEKENPEKVVALLNDYLEEMTRIALSNDGTIDKIMGDAVAVIFSAPVEQKDHAQRAVACALEMDRFCETFSNQQRRQGTPMGDTRIGVNTGPVLIGNVGSESHFDYRALGDAINTASRLEGANRFFGTRVCVGQATVDRCPEFAGRPVGTLMLKGKELVVDAFEPSPDDDIDSERLDRYQRAFQKLSDEDRSATDAVAELHAAWPDDPLVAFYHRRLESGQTGTRIVLEGK